VPSGAAVIKYDGKRGVTWKVKYRDADGRQVKETVGSAADGWTKRKAEAALRVRLVAVERDGYRKPSPETFAVFARGWLDTFPEQRQHRRTTRADYRAVVENHLIPWFGSMRLTEITTAEIDRYVASKRRGPHPLGPRTLGLHLTRLGSIFDSARRQGVVPSNPVTDAERPRVPKTHWTILLPVEIATVMAAFDDLIAEADSEPVREWRQTAKAMVLAMQYAWLRRGELLGLHWRHVDLAHPNGPRLHVVETWVRGHVSDPKTDDGARTIALAAPLAEELWQHRLRSRFQGQDELVFCHPVKGTPVPSGYFGPIVKLALARAGVEKPMREFHDWRHTGITNAAAARMSPLAIMRMAGHADFKTTQRYIDLAGVLFDDEVALLGDWYEANGTKSRYQNDTDASATGMVADVDAVRD
jgi:integrase